MVPQVSLVAGALGILAAVPALLGSRYVAWGKFRHRDRLLALVDWRGDERVLDVGTGGGLMAIGAAHRVPRGSVIGVDVWLAKDLSGNAAERARHNVRLEGVAERVEIRDGDARALPFTAGSIDVLRDWALARAAVTLIERHGFARGRDLLAALAEWQRRALPRAR